MVALVGDGYKRGRKEIETERQRQRETEKERERFILLFFIGLF